MKALGNTELKPEKVECVLRMVAVFSRLGACEQFHFLVIGTFSGCIALSDRMPWTLMVRGHQPVKAGSGWHGPGCSPDHTWRAIAEQDAGGESGGNWCRGGWWGETRRMEKTAGEGHRGPL